MLRLRHGYVILDTDTRQEQSLVLQLTFTSKRVIHHKILPRLAFMDSEEKPKIARNSSEDEAAPKGKAEKQPTLTSQQDSSSLAFMHIKVVKKSGFFLGGLPKRGKRIPPFREGGGRECRPQF